MGLKVMRCILFLSAFHCLSQEMADKKQLLFEDANGKIALQQVIQTKDHLNLESICSQYSRGDYIQCEQSNYISQTGLLWHFFNIKSANLARKLDIIQMTFTFHDFKLIFLFYLYQ